MKKIALALIAVLTLSACSSILEEEVVINSNPQGAVVMFGDEIKGTTPLSIMLPKTGTYEVTILKEGYKPQKMTIASLRKDSYVKFGPLVDAGYYKTLKPSCDKNELKPDFLPEFKGTKAFEDMQNNLNKVDQLKKDGKISDSEHSYMIKKIIEFYSAKTCPKSKK